MEVIVVGGGLAGLAAAMRLAERKAHVKVVSVTAVKRSHSVCAQGGINAAFNYHDENDSPYIHAYDTIKAGDFLADQPPVLEMCLSAPGIIDMMDRFGCCFNRTPAGILDVRRFGGTLYHRTAFSGSATGQQLLYTLDEQVRRWEVQGRIQKYEYYEFLRLILDERGEARGIVVLNLFNLKLEVLKADAVVFATGGPGLIFKKSTNSTFCTGAANGRLFMQGMHYANGEFIQIHPTALPGKDKLRLISESVRAEGGRIWVWGDSLKSIEGPDGEKIPCGKTNEKWFFLEEMYPAYGNLVSRDVAAREILRVCELGLGIDGKAQVYLDATGLSSEKHHNLETVLDTYQKFTGEDPRKVPMRIFPAMHYSMGGAWVDWPAQDDPDREQRFRQMTNLQGCFNCGESDFQYHGANRLGANALLSCLYSGLVTGDEVVRYLQGLSRFYHEMDQRMYVQEIKHEEEKRGRLLQQQGTENIYHLHETLSKAMVHHVTVKRDNTELKKTIDLIHQLREQLKNVQIDDRSRFANKHLPFVMQFEPMLELALVMTKSALLRDEFRGAHYKPQFPQRDDDNWLKTTVASYKQDEPSIFYKKVDLRHLDVESRDYTKEKKGAPELKNIPKKFYLPV